MPELTHLPGRPGWDCRACGRPWPCGTAREELTVRTGGGTRLVIEGWAYLADYVRDQPAEPVAEAFDRFIRWTHQSSASS